MKQIHPTKLDNANENIASSSATAHDNLPLQSNDTNSGNNKKYVSMFRIDGVPILPPLMTNEKRRQMQKDKSKALRLELKLSKKLEELRSEGGEEINETPRSALDMSDITHSPNDSLVDNKRTEIEDSFLMLSNLLYSNEEKSCEQEQSNEIPLEYRDQDCQTDDWHSHKSDDAKTNEMQQAETAQNFFDSNNCSIEDHGDADENLNKEETLKNLRKQLLDERLRKLQKSEVLIYDNLSNTIIMPIKDVVEKQVQVQIEKRPIGIQVDDYSNRKTCQTYQLVNKMSESSMTEDDQSNNNNNNNNHSSNNNNNNKNNNKERPRKLCFENVTKSIPSICVNPPTPMIEVSHYTEVGSLSESNSSSDTDENETTLTKENKYCDKFTSDESSTSLSNRALIYADVRLKSPSKSPISSNRIIKYKKMEIDLTAEKCSYRTDNNNTCPPRRAVTSPSLKPISNSDHIKNNTLNISSAELTAQGNPLIRSNSFTLDCPSKALIEHMRQQKEKTFQKRILPSPSTIRDTVESRAKRVQKPPEQKALPPCSPVIRVHSKPSGVSLNCTNLSNTLIYRNKRTPYEPKFNIKAKYMRAGGKSPTTALTAHKPKRYTITATSTPEKKRYTITTTTTTTPMCKQKVNTPTAPVVIVEPELYSIISTTQSITASGRNEVKSPANRLTSSTASTTPATATNLDLSEIEIEHRKKFLHLIAQQQEEQKRLQDAFEAQHHLLLQQLNVEMNRAKMRNSAVLINEANNSIEINQNHQQHTNDLQFNQMEPLTEEPSPLPSTTSVMSATTSLGLSTNPSFLAYDLPSLDTVTETMNATHSTSRRRLFSADSSVQASNSLDAFSMTGSLRNKSITKDPDICSVNNLNAFIPTTSANARRLLINN